VTDYDALPPFLTSGDASPAGAVQYFLTATDRDEMIRRLGAHVGFDPGADDLDRDRLDSEELAQILVFVLVARGEI